MSLEKEFIRLGFVRLTDCAPLVIAKEKCFFEQQGLEVALSREPTWANIRDKVAFDLLDGAQMLAAMPIAATLGIEGWKKPMITAYSLSLNGNAITIGNKLHRQMQEVNRSESGTLTAQHLKTIVRQSKTLLRFATVYPFSCHNYLLRDWLAKGGIDPDREIELIVIPPEQMVAHLKAGSIDGFCVGAPWNTQAEELGIGHIITSSYDIYPNHPEKVFAVNLDWAKKHPLTHQAILKALSKASRWLGNIEHIDELAEILAKAEYLNLPNALIKSSLKRSQLLNEDSAKGFYDNDANLPRPEHATWLIEQMQRWQQIPPNADISPFDNEVYRPQLYKDVITADA